MVASNRKKQAHGGRPRRLVSPAVATTSEILLCSWLAHPEVDILMIRRPCITTPCFSHGDSPVTLNVFSMCLNTFSAILYYLDIDPGTRVIG
jgi:hypothetical protein